MASSILFPHHLGRTKEEEKTLSLAKMLSGYDDKTWDKLKDNRKLTYIRAAQALELNWIKFKELIERP